MKSLYVVGIAGGSGSGKTTLANHIREMVDSEAITSIALDSYYRDFSHLSPEERARVNFDEPGSLEFSLLIDHIKKLKNGVSIETPIYDFKTHTRLKETIAKVPHPVIILEGILIYAEKALNDLIDLKVFIDVTSDIRIIRRIYRDMVERGRFLDSITQQYLKTVRPMHNVYVEPCKEIVDIIIPEGGENKAAVDIISLKIRTVIHQRCKDTH